ncbi:FAD binding domain-containing protein [Prauserella endophytica]|uniref:Xanthine dehydrogenase family protein subunit M n=1 Tax=Prauserella endophytica TaxID=1592324 RepID=A0ABY2RZE5_9PSEU|nr:xanthine dehydrogenase family protein subunit M [Prauserella endophytica]PXY24916.1 molybdopterin dehydrogenase [Prauserella coralliicola]TKG66674.1 xanthine dehydrogenase family protein subunit M [Prauserella endophytica]
MIPFDYRRADDVDSAVATVTGNPRAAFLGGGTNLVDHMKLGIAEPELLVDVTGLPLDRVEELPDGGLRIGTNVRNSDLAAHPLVRERYPVLAQAVLAGASGQLRNLATTGGNLLQRTRCVYFQDVTTPCNKRTPGEGCAALHGYTRYHAVLGASPHCVAVHPSDLAVALTALDAVVRVRRADGERTVRASALHRLPGAHAERDTVLEHGELITAVDLPPLRFAANSRYRKARDRASYAFALVSVAAALDVADGRVRDVRLALGGVAHKPWHATLAEHAMRGGPATVDAFQAAADAELAEAEPLPDNGFKLKLARNMIVSALRGLAGEDAP